MMNQDIDKLIHFSNAINPLPKDTLESFINIWEPLSAGRKEILTSTGSTEKHLYFVLDGIQRVYYDDEQNREATLVFTYAPSFGGVLDSMLLNTPSRYYYETLSPSRFLRAPFSQVKKIAENSPELNNLLQLGVYTALSGLLERMVELQSFSSEEKFVKLLKRSPQILKQIPHKYIANYLGIDPTNFSKLLNKVKYDQI